MKKRLAALLLSFLIILSFLAAGSSAEEELLADIVSDTAPVVSDDSGDTFCLLTDAEALYELAGRVNGGDMGAAEGRYLLTDDVVLDGTWTPIGTESFPFRGSFDGGGKKIVFRSGSAEECFGLFGVAEGAELSHIALENVSVSVSENCAAFGALVGILRGGSLRESYVSGEISSDCDGVSGGLVGILDGGRIENCFSAADLTVRNCGGGLAGNAVSGAVISCCYGIGFVRGLSGADFDALLALSDGSAVVENCYNIDSSGMYFGSRLTREEASCAESFVGYDFTGIWQAGSGENYPYPVLRALPFTPEQSFAPAVSYPVSGVTELPHTAAPSSALAHEGILTLDGAPSSYITPNLPPVRDQGKYNICWAFADCAAAEISLIRKGLVSPKSINLSELQLVRMHHDGPLKNDGKTYNDPLDNFGGDRRVVKILDGDNDILSSKTLASWMGLMQEDSRTQFSSTNADYILKKALPYEYAFSKDCAHLENEREFPLSDTEDVKNAILEYGGVTMAYNHQSAYFTKNQTYYYSSEDVGTNHAVIIVGWDDSISRALFYDSRTGKRPDRDGAWIIRNSHGASANDNGLIYMSYASSVFTAPDYTGYAWDYSPADKYELCYQYDGGVGIDHLVLNCPTLYEANIFQASGTERLEAVSFWLDNMSDVDFTVKIYTNLRNTANPSSGTLAATVSGTTTYAGYYTVPLSRAVELSPGSRFSVVIRLDGKNSYFLPLDKEWIIDWFSSYGCSEAGQSFYGIDGRNWVDQGADNGGNLRIKAFTSKSKPNLSKSTLELSQSIYTYDGNEKKPVVTVLYNGVTLRSNKDYTLSYADNVSAGTARVIVTGIGEYEGSAEKTFTILKAGQLISARIQPKEILVGGKAKIQVTGAKGCLSLSVSDPSVISVDSSGVVTGRKLGSAVIGITAAETENYSAAKTSVSLSVAERIRGDADGNGLADKNDLTCLISALAGAKPSIDSINSDLNSDGRINAVDVLLLNQILSENS